MIQLSCLNSFATNSCHDQICCSNEEATINGEIWYSFILVVFVRVLVLNFYILEILKITGIHLISSTLVSIADYFGHLSFDNNKELGPYHHRIFGERSHIWTSWVTLFSFVGIQFYSSTSLDSNISPKPYMQKRYFKLSSIWSQPTQYYIADRPIISSIYSDV